LLEVPVNPLTLGYRLASRTQQISMLASAAAARARRVLVQ
jgi:hypothetical protein